jgi:hypothetical protein
MHIRHLIAGIFAATASLTQANQPLYSIAERQIREVTHACSAFEILYGVFPPQTNWVAEFTASTNAILNRGKIVFLNTRIQDPWQRNLVYRYPGKYNTVGPDVYSLGKDGKSSSGGNDPDDINNWNRDTPWREHYSKFGINLRYLAGGIAVVFISLVLYGFLRRRMKTQNGVRP